MNSSIFSTKPFVLFVYSSVLWRATYPFTYHANYTSYRTRITSYFIRYRHLLLPLFFSLSSK